MAKTKNDAPVAVESAPIAPPADPTPESTESTEAKKKGRKAKAFRFFPASIQTNIPEGLESRDIQIQLEAAIYVDANGKVCKASDEGAKLDKAAVVATAKSIPLPKVSAATTDSAGNINAFLTHYKNVEGFNPITFVESAVGKWYEDNLKRQVTKTKDALPLADTALYLPEVPGFSTPDPAKLLHSELSQKKGQEISADEAAALMAKMMQQYGFTVKAAS